MNERQTAGGCGVNVTDSEGPERTMMGLGWRLNGYPATEGEENGVGG